MEISSAWLIGMVVAIGGIGMQLYFQGEAMAHPEKTQDYARRVLLVGKIWLTLSVLYLAVFVWYAATGR